ncbi:MAG: cysteine synthase family protein [Firmicutes bacterium]|nr:cysteine synthase family protein [Bacillota bacterium]
MYLQNSILDAIGNTPMVCLDRIVEKYDITGHIFAKAEYLNPGFSKKDRIALSIIEEAEQSGSLVKGQDVVELTSGNTGTGLAIVCAVKGYHFVACMSKGNSMERARMMRALGAEVMLINQAPGSVAGQVSGEDLALVELAAQAVVKERGAFRADQFKLYSNVRAYEQNVIKEILEQTGGQIDAFADFIGTGGSFTGCAKGLKAINKQIHCYVVEPETAAYYAKPKEREAAGKTGHKIQGGGYFMDLPLLSAECVDGYLTISDEEATETAKDLAKYEGIFAGFSSGANVRAAVKLLSDRERGKNIFVFLNDSGLKYLSTDLYE